ncbi:DMT family transporter [Jeotgalibacillus sp. R-1-5s-1]|uniref:EamA family transporter n=1 Tax=Jeotgalibacillus sp. R-1-5s-1 TaxID=2555897 RepID=UPI00106D47A0|nr:DMT family transporter [Jeotgalibacillus sp. R-1-5s-1]TFE00161.1 EamA family transporter [Jeotgalibacillus sp. R-1-5s-1]
MNNADRWIGILLVTLGATFWGVGGTVAKRLFETEQIPVEWLVSVRLLIAGALLLIIAMTMKNKANVIRIWKDRPAVFQLVTFSILGMLGVQYTYMASIDLGNAAVATLLQYLAPVFILAYLIIRRISRFTVRDLIGVLLALSGTYLLLTNGSIQTLSVPAGAIIWGVLSGVALAFYTLYAGNLLAKWGSLNVIGWGMLIGGATMALIHPPWVINTTGWTGATLVSLGFVIVFGTMLAFWFYLESLRFLKPQETSLLGSVEPLAAIVTSVLWLQLTFGLFQIGGAALIILMVIYLSVVKETPATSQTERKTA